MSCYEHFMTALGQGKNPLAFEDVLHPDKLRQCKPNMN